MLKTPITALPFLKVLGDAHMGRRFNEGVPVHRRGEREAQMLRHFCLALITDVKPTDRVVQTGDIFDGFAVPNAVVLDVYAALVNAQAHTGAEYVIYRGNHDAARDTDKKSSFDILETLFKDHPKIWVLSNTEILEHQGKNIGFMPWHPFKSSKELALELAERQYPLAVVFTHCDLESYGGSDFNLMPYEELAKITTNVVNGHVHTPETRVVYDVPFIMVGSMEPYSHGEDPDEEFYVTMTLAELFVKDPYALKYRNVRVLLEEGESPPDEIPDCLSFTVKRVVSKEQAVEDDSEVIIQDFSLSKIIVDCLKSAGVGEAISTQISAKYEESRNVV